MATADGLVTFGFGEFHLAEPHLEGWHEALGELKPGDYETIAELFQKIEAIKADAKGAGAEVARLLFPLVGRTPHLVAKLLAACLRTGDNREPVPSDATRYATPGDLAVFVREAAARNVFAGLVELMGNVRSLATTPTAAASSQA